MLRSLRIYLSLLLSFCLLAACGGSGTAPKPESANRAPKALTDSYIVDSNTDLPVTANDSDPDGDPISITSVTQPANGSVEIVNSQLLHLVIDQEFTGVDQFNYTISDGNGGTATARVNLQLNPAAKAPKAVNDRVTGTKNVVQVINVLGNDSDSNGDQLSVVAVDAPANGVVSIRSDQTVQYIPNTGFIGQDDFSYTISDGQFEVSANVTILLTDAPVGSNLPPVANSDSVAILFEKATQIDVLIDDFDPENDPLQIIDVIGPDHGTVAIKTISRNGVNVPAIEYTPNPNYTGPDSFIYIISDGNQSAATTVVIDVRTEAKNLPPLAKDDLNDVIPASTITLQPFANDSDPENDQLSFVSITAAEHGVFTIDDNGTPDLLEDDTLSYTPDAGFNGTEVLVYTLSDGISEDRAAINFYVADVPLARTRITGSVHKGAVRNSLVSVHPFDRNGIGQLNLRVVAATTEVDGSWVAEIPATDSEYMLTAQRGQFIDESDPDINVNTKRVIDLSDDPILQSMWQNGQVHVSITPYTSAFIRKARHESTNSFPATIKNNRLIAIQAMGFDPFATQPAEPISPAADSSLDAMRYALDLGGFANVMNAHVIDRGIALPTALLINGVINDLADCDINGLTFDGPINVMTPVGNKVFTDVTDLNPEIRRFKNNNFSLYPDTVSSFDKTACSQSGVSTDTTAPSISLNPTSNGELDNVALNVGDAYVEAGVSASDNIDGDLSDQVTIVISDGVNTLPAIDTNIPGNYIVTYTVVDDSGNVSSIARTVIVNNPVISIVDSSVTEGDVGTVDMTFFVSLSAASNVDVTVTATTSDGSATLADSDYVSTTQLVTIPANQLQASFTVTVNGDSIVESTEFFNVTLSNPLNAELDVIKFTATGDIINDDSTNLTISGASVLEGDAGTTTNLPFTITLSELSAQDVSVDFMTVDGSATVADNDYVPLTGSVTTIVIPAGSTNIVINIPVKGDSRAEPDETFAVMLSNAVNAALGNVSVTGTILNDDVPFISIGHQSINESDSGSIPLDFTVSLDQASTQDVSVDVTLADQTTSLADNDYQLLAPFTLTFLAGETSKTFSVFINGDVVVENDETFTLTLSNPSGAVLDPAASIGVGTIINDDGVTLSINDVLIVEGDAGNTNAVFNVTMSNPNDLNTVTVNYQTQDATATAGTDYLSQFASVSFAPGDTIATVSVPVIGDTLVENAETFTVFLSNPVNALISDDTGIATIENDDLSVVSIDSPGLVEGNSGQTNMVFTLTLDQASTQAISIDFSTTDATALSANGDYIATAGNVIIPAGFTTGQINIPVVGDTNVESDETFNLNLLSATNANLAETSTVATILNDDLSVISIVNATLNEANSDLEDLVFIINLDQASPVDVTFDVIINNGTATGGVDFDNNVSTQVIPAGSSTVELTIDVFDDPVIEDDESFTLTLDNPVNAILDPTASSATGIIVDNDVAVLSINNVSVLEGAAINVLAFTVSLDQVSNVDVSFTVATSDGSASLLDNDYQVIPATVLTIPAGSLQLTVSVSVIDDVLVEIDETVMLNLSAASNATIDPVAGTGVGTIINDDGVTISITDASILEGDAGTQNMVFAVSLSNPNNIQTVTVDYTTTDGTAISGSDYTTTSGTVSFAPGVENQTIVVPVSGDLTVENDEIFTVQLSMPTNSAISDGIGQGTITNDDATQLSISDVSQAEDAGAMLFTVSLDNPADSNVTVNYTTTDATATTADADYTLTAGTLTFAAGVTSQTITVPVNADTVVESDETFTVDLSNPSVASILDGQGLGTISNDDATQLSISDVSQVEDAGAMLFTVSLDNPADSNVTVNYTTTDATATTADADYTLTAGTLTFAAGVTSQTITVPVNADTVVESDETFTVDLSNPSVASILDGQGLGTISNDDATQLSISDVSQVEDAGAMLFTVSLDNPADSNVTVNYTTTDATATTADADYTSTAGTLTFAAGVTSQTITVPVNADTVVESDETFTVDLSNPSVASILDGQGIGTIINDDFLATLTLELNTVQDNGLTDLDTAWTITATGPTTISGIQGDPAITSASVNSGDYSLSATGPVGYTQTNLTCTSGLSGSTVTLLSGENVTCTFTLDDDVPTYTMSFTADPILDDDLNGMDSVGDVIAYNYSVTNTGTVPLLDVLVDSVLFTPSTICDFPVIAVGASDACTVFYDITQAEIDAVPAQVVNDSSVSATDLAGNPIAPASVSAAITTPLTIMPGLSVNEVPDDVIIFWNDVDMNGNASANDILRLTLRAENTGNTRLTGVVINNNLTTVPASPLNCGTLEVGQFCEIVVDYSATPGLNTSTTTATALDSNSNIVLNDVDSTFNFNISGVTIGDSDGDGVADVIENTVLSDPNNFNTSVIYVDPAATGLNDGSSWGNAYTGLPSVAQIGSGISAADPVFVLIKGGNTFAAPVLNFNANCDHITIVGSLNDVFPAKIEITEQGGATTGFDLSAGNTAVVNGCTNFNFIGVDFENGTGAPNPSLLAGALDINNSSVGIFESAFENNTAGDFGGAISVSGTSTVEIVDSLFENNFTIGALTGGGAIDVSSGSVISVTQTRFINNNVGFNPFVASSGGAVYLDNANAIFDESVFSGNASTDDGGAIAAVNDSALTITDSIISGNFASNRGGGVYLQNVSTQNVSIFNNLFSGNSGNFAGAISQDASVNVSIKNNTFVFNQANTGSSGAYHSINSSDVLLVNNIFKDNRIITGNDYLKNFIFLGGSTVTQCSNNWVYENLDLANCPLDIPAVQTGAFYESPHVTTGYYIKKNASAGAKNKGDGSAVDVYNPADYTPDGAYAEIAKVDTGGVDLGYHYLSVAPPIPDAVTSDVNTLVANSAPAYQRVIITPTAAGQKIGPGQAVYAQLPGDIEAVWAFPTPAGEQLNRNLKPLIDLGNGEYELRLATGDTETFNVIIDANGFVSMLPITVL